MAGVTCASLNVIYQVVFFTECIATITVHNRMVLLRVSSLVLFVKLTATENISLMFTVVRNFINVSFNVQTEFDLSLKPVPAMFTLLWFLIDFEFALVGCCLTGSL